MNSLETFFFNYEKTIAALGAVSTFAAVVTSLYLARRSEKTRLKSYVSGTFITHSSIDPNNRPKFVSVNIINLGSAAIRIPFSFFCWKVPFCKESLLVCPFDSFGIDPMIPVRQYPFKVEPKHSESFIISDRETFYTEMKKAFDRFWLFPLLRANFIQAIVCTDDGTVCKVNVSKQLRKELVKYIKGAQP